MPKSTHAPERDKINTDNDLAIPNTDSTCKSDKYFITNAKPPTTNVITPTATNPLIAIGPIAPTIANDTDIDNNTMDNAEADAIADSIGNWPNKNMIPPISPTATVITIRDANPAVNPLAMFNMPAKTSIATDNTESAFSDLVKSINDRAISEAAIIPMATPMAIIAPLDPFAYCEAIIIRDSIMDKSPTAIMPLAKLSISTKLRATATADNIAIAATMAKSVPAILEESFSATCVIFTKPNINNSKNPMATIPLAISVGFNLDINLIATINNNIDADIASMVLPTSFILSPARFVVTIRPIINNAKSSIHCLPTSKALGSNLDTDFITNVNNKIANDILRRVPPIILALFPISKVAAINPAINRVNEPMQSIPLSNALGSNLDTILSTFANISIDTDNVMNVHPILLIFSDPLSNFSQAHNKAINEPIIAVNPPKATKPCFQSIVDNINIAEDNVSTAFAISTNAPARPTIFNAFLTSILDTALLTAIAKPPINAVIVVITNIAHPNDAPSFFATYANKTRAPTRIAIDIARSFNAFAFVFIANPLRTLPNPVSAFPAPSNTLLIPFIGPVNTSKASEIFLRRTNIPTPNAAANTAPKSKLLSTSSAFEPNFFNAVITTSIPLLIALTKPNMKLLPISSVSVDGECMPRTFLIASSICLPKFIKTSIIVDLPSSKPFFSPAIKFFPISGISVKVFLNFLIDFCTSGSLTNELNKSFIYFIAFLILDITLSKLLFIRLLLNIQSLSFTIASPIDAVALKISISIFPNNLSTILNAILNGPPITVVSKSNKANTPLKVLFNLSAVSLLIFNFKENLCIAAIILYKCSVFCLIISSSLAFP